MAEIIKQRNKEAVDWRKIVYETQIETIKHAKDIRWKIVYYNILIYISLYAIRNYDFIIGKEWLIALTIFSIISGVYFVITIQKDIYLCRNIIELIKKDRSDDFRDLLRKVDTIVNKCKNISLLNLLDENKFIEDFEYVIIILITIISGGIILINLIIQDC